MVVLIRILCVQGVLGLRCVPYIFPLALPLCVHRELMFKPTNHAYVYVRRMGGSSTCVWLVPPPLLLFCVLELYRLCHSICIFFIRTVCATRRVFLRFSSHGQCNISDSHGQTCFSFYQARYPAYIHNTIFLYLLWNFARAWTVFTQANCPCERP